MLVMVILEAFTHEEEVPGESILGVIVGFVIAITVLVPAPVDKGTMKRTNQVVYG
jgi:hypothetical protein